MINRNFKTTSPVDPPPPLCNRGYCFINCDLLYTHSVKSQCKVNQKFTAPTLTLQEIKQAGQINYENLIKNINSKVVDHLLSISRH